VGGNRKPPLRQWESERSVNLVIQQIKIIAEKIGYVLRRFDGNNFCARYKNYLKNG
jgi:hypothetical protein